MSHRQPLQPAYILHSRPYRDTSLILELLTPEEGRISCVARGARRDKQRRQHALQPFTPLLLSLMGRGSLKTLGQVENSGSPAWLRGRAVYAGLYANELLVRTLAEGEAQYTVFACYQSLLQALASLDGNSAPALEPPLRRFELQLLGELGQCPELGRCAESRQPLSREGCYRLEPESGFVPVHRIGEARLGDNEYTGTELLALARAAAGELPDAAALPAAKRLTRLLLSPLLGTRPLRSRELFRQVYSGS